MNEIKGTTILIAGFGREGKSVFGYIRKRYPNVNITIADTDAHSVSDSDAKVVTGAQYLKNLDNYDTVVRSPGIPKTTPELLKARYVTTATNIFFSQCRGIVIGVTGTKGKSTTSSLIYHILKTARVDCRLVGNIGIPALDLLDGSNKDTVFVMELSSYQLDDIKYSPHIVVVLPIFLEHLNYHGNVHSYIKAKSHIVEKQTAGDFVIYCGSNSYSKEIALQSKAQKIPYNDDSQSPASWIENGSIWVASLLVKVQRLIRVSDVSLQGTANYENITACVIASIVMNIDTEVIRSAIASFQRLEHRLEYVGTFKGISFYNDSLATIPEATMHAIETLKDKTRTLIAGGFERGLDMTTLGNTIARSDIKTLILLPTTGGKIARAVTQANPRQTITMVHVSSLEEAVKTAYQSTPKNFACLMSPAAASFNMFKDYASRGDQFKKWVVKIGG